MFEMSLAKWSNFHCLKKVKCLESQRFYLIFKPMKSCWNVNLQKGVFTFYLEKKSINIWKTRKLSVKLIIWNEANFSSMSFKRKGFKQYQSTLNRVPFPKLIISLNLKNEFNSSNKNKKEAEIKFSRIISNTWLTSLHE